MQHQVQTQHTPSNQMVSVLCCMCGTSMIPNSSNTCATCLASSCDITRGISTEVTIHQCRGCQRWHKDSNKWVVCDLESRELMALCLQHVNGLKQKGTSSTSQQLNKVHLTDATWIWTEPHSMRLKVQLTIQREVQKGIILQQSFIVVFIVRNQQCIECQSEFRQGSWKSLIQVRQRVLHKRTFLFLEQLILKHDAHRGSINIVTYKDGMDFYFPDKGKAARFIAFLDSVVPIKMKHSKKLISTDDKNNLTNFKYTHYVEICPLCKDDLLFLSKHTARQLGTLSRIVLVKNVTNVIHLIDPLSGQIGTLSADAYWRDPFRPLITAARSRMAKYVILHQEPILLRKNIAQRGTQKKQRHKLGRLTLVNDHDFGKNDIQIEELSHQGYLFKAGDMCVGYNLKEIQLMDDEAEQLRMDGKLPDAIVVRKLYQDSTSSSISKKRLWKLRRLEMQVGDDNNNGRTTSKTTKGHDENDMDEEDFLQEVEADRDMRSSINLYKSDILLKKKLDEMNEIEENDGENDSDDDDQKIQLDELLDGLNLDDGPDQDDDDMQDGLTNVQPDMHPLEEGEAAARDGISYVNREAARTVRDKDVAVPVTSLGKEFSYN